MSNKFRSSYLNNLEDITYADKAVKPPKKIVTGLSELTIDEISILIELVDNGFKDFIFHPELSEFLDNALETSLNLLGRDTVISAINSLENKQYLNKIELEPSLQCPSCFSSQLEVSLSCPECSSTRIKKSDFIEHPYCGYKNEKTAFTTGGNLVCPKCKISISGIETVHTDESDQAIETDVNVNTYRVIRAEYKCYNCNSTINQPEIDFQCSDCGTRYNYVNAMYQIPIKYIIPEPIFEKILSRNKVSLLIVEDFTPQADVVAMLLSSSGSQIEYKIAIAENGSSAILALEENEFDFVILDLGLPDIDGLNLLKEIKNNWPDTKIIVLTGYDDIEIAVEAMKNGATEFFVKKTETIENLPNILEKLISDDA